MSNVPHEFKDKSPTVERYLEYKRARVPAQVRAPARERGQPLQRRVPVRVQVISGFKCVCGESTK